MIVATPTRVGEIARSMFDILVARGEGVPVNALLQEIELTLPLSPWERTKDIYHGMKPFEEMAHAGAIALIKAGWMKDAEGVWAVTEKGRRAYVEITDPEEFITRSANQSVKGWMIIHLPRLFAFLSRVKTQFDIERQMVRRLGPRLLLAKVFRKSAEWEKHLPIQAPRRFVIREVDLKCYGDLVAYLDASGIDYRCAGHTIYLPPKAASASAFKLITSQYPSDAGLKIMKNPGGVDGAYLFGGVRNRKISVMYNRMTYDRARLVLVANLLFSKELTSRVYDLIEIVCGDQLWTAYVVRHLPGQPPTEAECNAGIDRIKQLEREGLLKVTLSQGYDDEDFSCPACNNNAFMDNGKFCYVDFQSFLLINYEGYLTNARAAAYRLLQGSCESGTALTSGGRKADSMSPWDEQPKFKAIRRVLEQAGVRIQDRVVLDLGCGSGDDIAGYLKLGAAWCNGWDNAAMIKGAERFLLGLGCTRFSLSEWSEDTGLPDQWPEFLKFMVQRCIVSVSARCRLEDLEAQIDEIPWTHLIYESSGASSGPETASWHEFENDSANMATKASASYEDEDGVVHRLTLIERRAAAAPKVITPAKKESNWTAAIVTI